MGEKKNSIRNSPGHRQHIGGRPQSQPVVRLDVPAANGSGRVVLWSIESGDWLFYGLVTDLQLDSLDPRLRRRDRLPPAFNQYRGQTSGSKPFLPPRSLPALMLEHGPDSGLPRLPRLAPGASQRPAPVAHQDHPLAPRCHLPGLGGRCGGDFRVPPTGRLLRDRPHAASRTIPSASIWIKFVQRSSGIFGATGTGNPSSPASCWPG